MQIKITNPQIQNPNFKKLFIPCYLHQNPILRKAVHKLKYSFYKDISKNLASLFDHFKLPENAQIVPIPLHKKRLKYRGFNQAEILAENLGRPITNLLIRIKKTKSQATLSKYDREKNIKKSFVLNPEISLPKNTQLIIIDDICTTFSTMNEAAITLKKAGFELIYGMALAHCELKSKK
ncbi:ComF family protein [Patescibacteria group bacterium]